MKRMTSTFSPLALLTLGLVTALPLAAHEPTTSPQEPSAQTQAAENQMPPEMQAMMQAWQKAATPGPQHQQLTDQFVGDWTTKTTMWMDPSAPPMTETGKASTTAVLGGRQVRSDFSSTMMGQPYQGIGYTGYDNVTGHYTSTWADNMSTGTMLANGDYDPAKKTYTYESEMPDPTAGGAMVPIRMDLRIVDADHHVFDMYESRGGKDVKTMMIEYARAK